MKNAILTAALSLSIAAPANALSCIAPDVATAFQQAVEAEESYVIVKGTFAFDPLPETETKEARSVDSQFAGRLMTEAGFTQNVTAPITVTMTCAGDWCAEVKPDTDYIAFVKNLGDSLEFEVGPCYAFAFQEPALEDVKRLENCAQGGACAPVTN